MKNILSVTFCLLVAYCNAQQSGDIDSTIELRFQWIEEEPSGQLALDVQVINHFKRDIYIPSFNYLTIHLYEQSDSGWNEIDLYTHQHNPRGTSNPALKRDNTDIRGMENNVNKYYKDSTYKFCHAQNTIIDEFCSLNPGVKKNLVQFIHPLFLKAGEEIGYYKLIAMDYLKQHPNMYKISYASEQWDFALIKTLKELAMELPKKVLNYVQYIPKTITANTNYYSTID